MGDLLMAGFQAPRTAVEKKKDGMFTHVELGDRDWLTVQGPLLSHLKGGQGSGQSQVNPRNPCGNQRPEPPLNKLSAAQLPGPAVVIRRVAQMAAPRPGCPQDTKALGKLKSLQAL